MHTAHAWALALSTICIWACAPSNAGERPIGPSSIPGSASPPPSGVRVVARDGTVLATYPSLTKSYSADEGLPRSIRCEPGQVPWLAGGRAARGGFVLCLAEHPDEGEGQASLVLSLSRTDLFHENRPGPFGELVHAWWSGGSSPRVKVQGGQVEVHGTVTLAQLTTPASFTGGVPDEEVRLEGTAMLVR